ncbi:MAG: hypothetical protein ACD_81C00027G0002 [uncultured bacterium]|uniref:Peptidoglycan binding-like domain-containing protein n=2 Tax=Candidatus Wolfeibacteriota TaxID=1752735 RepID=A0A0G1H895_9BACT|nr:MAG: hypothetical protein ACD_81C00027G0002 [uncultured bacterium]KKR13033.1 MAG: hypothetical protein UT41_C0001G0577 [Candidatus Wolfebacteria bacterium GW2011_GWC2_39_22]KKT42703.1 MAG: hypothetical protein UW32_C0004G0008 [Candidatus Wolfebacteria bacterium GW2011_GWE2_44_13]HBI26092.1 hypothetical protein [Candidatus Wolfebacteria bacterium]
MHKIKLLGVIAFAGILLSPAFTSAATIEELQAQLNALIKQITVLQEQIKQQKGNATSTSAIENNKPIADNRWCYNFNKSLKVGAKGADVTALQTTLEKEGIAISEVDKKQAVFGVSTASAVEKFQEINKSSIAGFSDPTARGIFGPQTRSVIDRVYGCGQGSVVTKPIANCPQIAIAIPVCKDGEEVVAGPKDPNKIGDPCYRPAPVCKPKINIAQAFCGGIQGKICPTGTTCKLDGSYPDAGGVCVPTASTYACPQYSPPAPGYCAGGTMVPRPKDEHGCAVPATCVYPVSATTTISTATTSSDY